LQLWYEEKGVGCPEALAAFDLLNEQLRADGIGQHFLVGHSHFMIETMDMATLRMVWQHSVMPLMDEYFFNQPERLGKYAFDVIIKQAQQQLQTEE
jgi:hypothetical protein